MISASSPVNVFDYIKAFGVDDGFHPRKLPAPTETAPGSIEKMDILRQRLENGEEMFHPLDRCNYDNLIAAIKPYAARYQSF